MIDTWLGLHLGLKILTVVLTLFAILTLALGPRRAIAVWRRFGHALGDLIARSVLTAFYFLVMPLFAAITLLTRDVLGAKATAMWSPPDTGGDDLSDAARQF